jgi:transcriptional regulator with XRE-family HTH domain
MQYSSSNILSEIWLHEYLPILPHFAILGGMAQKPALRHVLGAVRLQAGLSQSELAKLLGCAAVTVQKIEQGILGLSEELATKAEEEIGVAAAWLLDNDSTQPAVTPGGGLWTVDHYEYAQGARIVMTEKKLDGKTAFRLKRKADRTLPLGDEEDVINAFIALKTAEAASLIRAMLEGSKGLPRQGILVHRLRKALKALHEDFKPDKATLEKDKPEIEKLRHQYDEICRRISQEFSHKLWLEEIDSKD